MEDVRTLQGRVPRPASSAGQAKSDAHTVCKVRSSSEISGAAYALTRDSAFRLYVVNSSARPSSAWRTEVATGPHGIPTRRDDDRRAPDGDAALCRLRYEILFLVMVTSSHPSLPASLRRSMARVLKGRSLRLIAMYSHKAIGFSKAPRFANYS